VQAILNRASFQKPESEPSGTLGSLIPDSDSPLPRSKEESERLAPAVSMVAGGLVADQVKDTRTLRVTFTHTDPVITAAVANGVAQDFIIGALNVQTQGQNTLAGIITDPEGQFRDQGRNTSYYNIQDNASYTRGNHSFRFGFHTRREEARRFLEDNFVPWRLANPDGATEGTITGYYEPFLRGSRRRLSRRGRDRTRRTGFRS
jgi:hypothetical protein